MYDLPTRMRVSLIIVWYLQDFNLEFLCLQNRYELDLLFDMSSIISQEIRSPRKLELVLQ